MRANVFDVGEHRVTASFLSMLQLFWRFLGSLEVTTMPAFSAGGEEPGSFPHLPKATSTSVEPSIWLPFRIWVCQSRQVLPSLHAFRECAFPQKLNAFNPSPSQVDYKAIEGELQSSSTKSIRFLRF